jgi:hypothetical protein
MALMPPPNMAGIAPPMPGGPTKTPGPSKAAMEKLRQAGRLMFDAIEEVPHMTREMNEIIELLTTVMHQLAEPPDLPGLGPEAASEAGPLSRTPSGPPPSTGNPMASAMGGSANPLAMLARLSGRG